MPHITDIKALSNFLLLSIKFIFFILFIGNLKELLVESTIKNSVNDVNKILDLFIFKEIWGKITLLQFAFSIKR